MAKEKTIKEESVINGDVEQKKEESIKKEETVTVKKSDLDLLLSKLDTLTKNQDLLFKASDKSRLAKVMSDGNNVLIHTAKIAKWDGTDKYVIAWKLNNNRCEVFNGKWIEDQETSVVFNDGEVIKVPLLEYYRKTVVKESGDIISRESIFNPETQQNDEMMTIQFSDGNKIKINSIYIN